MSGFFRELRRRKVYRVAAAYIVAGGFIIQMASAVFPVWELPIWSLRLTIALTLAGFPLALLLAWAFDVTPSGIERTRQQGGYPRIRSAHRRNVLLLGAAGVLIAVAAGFLLWPRGFARNLEKSIAVLPFKNLSADPENAFFADGIQEDILTRLGKVSDLKVISRTSVAPYRDKPVNVREIGKSLDVSAVLEGSVRRAGDRVRVNVQLINAVTDGHIWSHEYEAELYDVFAIQSDLAHKISEELRARLSPDEKARLAYKPTDNTEAYLAFIEARNLHKHRNDIDKLVLAKQLYERAVQLDPQFALAYAHLAQLEGWIFADSDHVPARRAKAFAAAERALALQPDLPEAHLALGFCHYYGSRDYDAAEREFEIAKRGLPNQPDIYIALASIERRRGRWAESTAYFTRAVELDPNDTWALQNLSLNYERMRNFPEAIATIERALKINPKSLTLWGLRGWYVVTERGDFGAFREAERVAAQSPPGPEKEKYMAEVQTYAWLLERRYADLIRAAEALNDDVLRRELTSLYDKYITTGVARRALGDEPGAREAFGRARESAERMVREFRAPQNADAHAKLGVVLAYLGEKEEAIRYAQRATELQPESLDAFYGTVMTESLAIVYSISGEPDRAIDILDGLLSRPGTLTVPLLKLHPAWDPLRQHPRFVELLTRHKSARHEA